MKHITEIKKRTLDSIYVYLERTDNAEAQKLSEVYRNLCEAEVFEQPASTEQLKAEISAIADEIEHGFCSPSVDSKLIQNGIQRLRKLSAV